MADLTLIATLLGAILFGVLCTVLVQWASAVRTLTREVTHTTRQVSDLADLLRPTLARASRISAMVEDSEPDLRKTQLALRNLSESSLQISESVSRVSGWVALGTPLVMSAVERWAHHRPENPEVEREYEREYERESMVERDEAERLRTQREADRGVRAAAPSA